MAATDKESCFPRWSKVSLAIIIALILGSGTLAVETRLDLGERLAKIEANNFTAADGLDVWKEISRIREEMAKLPKDVPPAWFVDRVDKLEKRLARIEGKLN